jgi:hypothetical protein
MARICGDGLRARNQRQKKESHRRGDESAECEYFSVLLARGFRWVGIQNRID